MSDIVSPLLQWLNQNPEWAGFVTFAISAGESIAIIGTLVPGTITMTAIGTLAGAGVIPLTSTLFWAILGAIVGDGISYWIGHYFKDRIRLIWPFRNNPAILQRGEQYVQRYGVMSVFIGRFVGPVRALIPVVAGMLGMKPLQFTIANVTSAIGWAPIYMLPGILLGAASLELPPGMAMHVIFVLFLMGLFIILCLWIIYKLFQLIQNQTTQLQNWIWHQLKHTRYLSPATNLLKHHHPQKMHGQLSLALLFFITICAFFILVYYVEMNGAANILANEVTFHLFRGMRSQTFDNSMLLITFLGQKQVILPIVGVIFIWLLIYKRWRAAFHTLLLGILAGGSVFIGKRIIQSARPWGILLSPESYSMPSGHATLTITIFMGLAYLIAQSCRPNRRSPIYLVALLLTFFVGLSRLYLGAHWLTDILAGWLLGGALLILIVISYQRQPEKPISPWLIFCISSFTLLCSFSIFYYLKFDTLRSSYSQLPYPSQVISMENWWNNNNNLRMNKTRVLGVPSQYINIEWLGDYDSIQKSLANEGWKKPPTRDLISTLHRITDISSTQYLPLVAPRYFDKKPSLILTRKSNNSKSLLVIRLWNANRLIKGSNKPLWVGIIGTIPRSYSWLFKKNFTDTNNEVLPLLPTHKEKQKWVIKIITLSESIHQKNTPTSLLLIKPHTDKKP